MATKRIGILTGGGNCPGLNAAIRAVVKAGIGIHNTVDPNGDLASTAEALGISLGR